MKKITKILLVIIILFFYSSAFADTTIHLDIETPSNSIYNQNITVSPCDSDNNINTPDIATAYCAILQSGVPNSWDWSWPPGAFVTSINNISGYTTKDTDGNDVYHYWDWSLNEIEGATGLNEYELQPGDLISLNFIDPGSPTLIISHGSVGPHVDRVETVTPIAETAPLGKAVKAQFDVEKAFDFIISQQKDDGSFGESLYTDWAAFALASENSQAGVAGLTKYLNESKLPGGLLTDYERHAMALMALGLNPYSTNGENYIEKIVSDFDGKQFGNPDEDNDDIFALIVLQNAGFAQTDEMINKDINFILDKQKNDGSWDESADMTGAGIEALSTFSPDPGSGEIQNALGKAKEFLKQNQKDDGSFGNVSSTAWAMEGILALNEKPEDWVKNPADGGTSGNTPLDYLAIIKIPTEE